MFTDQVSSAINVVIDSWKKTYDMYVARSILGKKGYVFTEDYCSSPLTTIWKRHLSEFAGKKDVNFLEIGTFEGRATFWFLDNILTHPTSKITSIDSFIKRGGEPRFDHNIKVSGFAEKVTKIKGKSENILNTLPEESFDAVYIDGCHYAFNVLRDAILSWRLLKSGGIIIFDDYGWGPKMPSLRRPKTAIDIFLKGFEAYIEVLHKDYQVIIKKSPIRISQSGLLKCSAQIP